MNLQENISRIKSMMGIITEGLHDIYSYLNTETFNKLPYDYKKSLIIFRNERIGNDGEMIDELLNELTKSEKRKVFYYGEVPIDLIKEEVGKRMGYGTFDEFQKLFWSTDDTDHGDSVLPIIIDFNDEELIIDGWHRFNSYIRKGLNKIPVLGIYKD
jgi:hypothetical protein